MTRVQVAAANDNPERVLELAESLKLEKTLELAVRVADHYSMPQVASRISELIDVRFPQFSLPPPPPPPSQGAVTQARARLASRGQVRIQGCDGLGGRLCFVLHQVPTRPERRTSSAPPTSQPWRRRKRSRKPMVTSVRPRGGTALSAATRCSLQS